MSIYSADGTINPNPMFANDPTFQPQWEQLQKELGEVMKQAHSEASIHATNGRHEFYGACRAAIGTLTAMMNCQQFTPRAKGDFGGGK